MALGKCTGCGGVLVMDMSHRCRQCGKKANVFRAASGKTTWTKKGAVRVLEKELQRKKKELRGYERALTSGAAAEVERRGLAKTGLTWQEAEHLACDWMRKNGYRDAVVTPDGPDGGVDIRARKAIGQVKHHAKPVGIDEVQRLSGIARHEGKAAFLFAASGVTKTGLDFARKAGVTCVVYPPFERL